MKIFFLMGWALVISLLENSALKATPLEVKICSGPLKIAQPGFNRINFLMFWTTVVRRGKAK